MKTLPFLKSIGVAMMLAAASAAHSQTLEADYQLQGVYTSSVPSGIGPLTVTGDSTQVTFVTDTVDAQTQQVLRIGVSSSGAEAGVQTQTNPFVNPANYSAVLLSNFQISTTNTGITKIFDFKNLSSDAGLYINDATGLLGFYDGAMVPMLLGASSTPFASGEYVQIVLTRNSATNLVTVYANGTAQFSFTDSSGLAILGDATNTGNAFLTLYQDDGQGIGSSNVDEGTHGNIARLRLYDGVLTADQVGGLDRTIPEPATWALLAVGFATLLGSAPRRNRGARS
jgi:hypothetical protein